MNKDWYDFKVLNGGIEGARAHFEKACCTLLMKKYSNKTVHRIQPNPGDDGIDIIVGNINEKPDIYQCKFFLEKIGTSQKRQIANSYYTAIKSKKYDLNSWNLLIPKVFTTDELKWWEEWKSKQNIYNESQKHNINCIDGDQLIYLFKEFKLYEDFFKIEDSKLVTEMAKDLKELVEDSKLKKIPDTIRTQSEMALKQIISNNLVFVKSNHFDYCQKLLDKYNCCLISGNPGVGKTITAGSLAYLYIKKGYNFVYIFSNFDDLINSYNSQKKQIILFDDFLGEVSLNKKIQENDLKKVSNIIQDISTGTKSKIILTTREYILNHATIQFDIQREFLSVINRCTIFFDKYNITEKAEILYNHIVNSELKDKEIQTILENENYIDIITHKNFSPRIVKWMTTTYLSARESSSNFYNTYMSNLENPVEIWKTVFDKLSNPSKYLLLRMAFSNGTIDSNNATQFIVYTVDSSFDIIKINQIINECILELKDSMITIISTSEGQTIHYLNPSVFDYIKFYMQDKFLIIKTLLSLFNFEYSLISNLYKFSSEKNNRYIEKRLRYPGYKKIIFELGQNYEDLMYNSFKKYINKAFENHEKIFHSSLVVIIDYYLEYKRNIENLYSIFKSILSNTEIITLKDLLYIVQIPNLDKELIFSQNQDNLREFILVWQTVNDIDTFMKIYNAISLYLNIDNDIIVTRYYEQEKKLLGEIYSHFSLEIIQAYLEILEEFGNKFQINVKPFISILDSYFEKIRAKANSGIKILDEENILEESDDPEDDPEYCDEYELIVIKKLFNELSDT